MLEIHGGPFANYGDRFDLEKQLLASRDVCQALKLLGVESVLVRVPDEPHGIAVRPSHHMSKIHHIITWFDQHRNPAAR